MKVLEVAISKKHITSAEQQDARHCAIAQAIVESDDDIIWANVTTNQIKWARRSTDRIYAYRTPKSARDFIIAFDNGRHPKPFRLEIAAQDFQSERPRQLHQRERAEQIQRRKKVARATGRPLRDVMPEEAPIFNEEGFTDIKLPRDRVKPGPRAKLKSEPKTPPTPPRKYAHRATIAEALHGEV